MPYRFPLATPSPFTAKGDGDEHAGAHHNRRTAQVEEYDVVVGGGIDVGAAQNPVVIVSRTQRSPI